MLKPVARASLSDQVFAQLRDSILLGTYAPGERLPPERELCERFAVNRSSIREALKRLEHVRLIETRHGGGSTVLDFRSHGGFDLLRDLVAPGGQLNPLAARSLFELAAVTWPEMARLAALRADVTQLEAMEAVVSQIEACGPGQSARLQDLDLELFCLIARASENLALLLVLNSVKSVYDTYRSLFTAMYEQRLTDGGKSYRRMVQAIRRGQAPAAARACRKLLDSLAEAFGVHHPAVWPTP